MLAAFSARLKEELDAGRGPRGPGPLVHTALEPAHVSIWLSERGQLSPTATSAIARCNENGHPSRGRRPLRPAVRAVRDAFAANFAERGEVGAAVCVRSAAGSSSTSGAAGPTQERTPPWQRDTLVNVFSVGKGAGRRSARLRWSSAGWLDLDAPVAALLAGVRRRGQGARSRSASCSPTSAGLPGVRRPLPAGAMLDWPAMTAALARAGALVGAGQRARLPRQHLRLPGRRGRPAGDRQHARRAAARRGRRPARRRRAHRPARRRARPRRRVRLAAARRRRGRSARA